MFIFVVVFFIQIAYFDLLTVLMRYFFCGSFVLFMSCVCHAFALSGHLKGKG